MRCKHCGDEFEPKPGKPGYINECPEHSSPDVSRLGGNMVYEHKTAPSLEIKPLASAQAFARSTRRLGAGVTASITQSKDWAAKELYSASGGWNK